MNCTSCGAPLPSGSAVCRYCEKLNETDLRTLRRSARAVGATERNCPRCAGSKLQELRVEGLAVEVDRCAECHGIFFDLGELEQSLDRSTQKFAAVDRGELDRLIAEEPKFEKKVEYLKCPECSGWMTRRLYGKKSGVVIDRCAPHGVWLDGGELGALIKWARAGGREHDAEVREREARAALERARNLRVTSGVGAARGADGGGGWLGASGDVAGGIGADDLIDVFDIVRGLFR